MRSKVNRTRDQQRVCSHSCVISGCLVVCRHLSQVVLGAASRKAATALHTPGLHLSRALEPKPGFTPTPGGVQMLASVSSGWCRGCGCESASSEARGAWKERGTLQSWAEGPTPSPHVPHQAGKCGTQGPESHIYPHTHENEVTRGYMHMHRDERRDRRMHTDMCTQTHLHTHAKPHIDTHAHTGAHTHTHAHTKPHIDLCTHKTTHTSVHMHTHKPHIDLHTQTHKTTHRPAHTHSYVMASLATVVG